MLKNGKKVAPIDVDEYYTEKLPRYEMACCGINSEDEGYDEIHMFVVDLGNEKDNKTDNKTAIDEIMSLSHVAEAMYQIAEVHIVSKIPMTTVGKVRRFKLKALAEGQREDGSSQIDKEEDILAVVSVEERVKEIIAEHLKCDPQKITKEQNLIDDLGVDSLMMFEICVELEQATGLLLADKLDGVQSVEDLLTIIEEDGKGYEKQTQYDVNNYPRETNKLHLICLRMLMWFCRHIWKFEIEGLENIPKEGNFILAPNHESHLDGLWVWTALYEGVRKSEVENKINWLKICCMAKQEHLEHKFSKWFMNLVGGIPVDRGGNSIPAMVRCEDCIRNGYYFLIHPEGTRSRNGELGTLKAGVATLAINTKKKIIPVVISGAREIYNPNRKMPHFYNFDKKEKYKLKIEFLNPISPNKLKKEEIIERLEKNWGGAKRTSDIPKTEGKQIIED